MKNNYKEDPLGKVERTESPHIRKRLSEDKQCLQIFKHYVINCSEINFPP